MQAKLYFFVRQNNTVEINNWCDRNTGYLLVVISSLFCYPVFGQIEALTFGAPIKWGRLTITNGMYLHVGLDTLSHDTIEITTTTYRRINREGRILELLEFNDRIPHYMCSDEGYHLSGDWKSYYSDGAIKELGMVICNFKADMWLYFHPNGHLWKIENYLRLNRIVDSGKIAYLSGKYEEYYPNGNTKAVGSYRIVEQLSEDIGFDPMTYEEISLGHSWKPTSIKSGLWKYYSENGRFIEQKDESVDIEGSGVFREITD